MIDRFAGFAARNVCETKAIVEFASGDLLKGVRYRRGFALTESMVMRSLNGTSRRIETMHRQADQYEF